MKMYLRPVACAAFTSAIAFPAMASTQSSSPGSGCAPVPPVLERLAQNLGGQTGIHIDPNAPIAAPRSNGRERPAVVGGLWRGERPSLALYKLWMTSSPQSAAACTNVPARFLQAGQASTPKRAGPSLPVSVAMAVVGPAGDQAIVAVRVDSGALGSHDDLFFLKKNAGVWSVAGQGQLSIS